MSLIKCPECGKEVSDKAPACIHCGYPLQEQAVQQVVQPVVQPLSKKVVLPHLKEQYQENESQIRAKWASATMFMTDTPDMNTLISQPDPGVIKDGLTENFAKEFAQKLTAAGLDVEIQDSFSEISFASASKDKNIVCCPKCGSVEYFTGARGYSLLTGFIGSGKVMLTCAKCGHSWKPGR